MNLINYKYFTIHLPPATTQVSKAACLIITMVYILLYLSMQIGHGNC